MALTEALLLDPLTEESQRTIADAVGQLPAFGPGWWDRFPVEQPASATAEYQMQVHALALAADGAIGGH